MSSLPAWAPSLTTSQIVAELGFETISEAQRGALIADWLRIWDLVPFGHEFHQICRLRIQRAIPLLRATLRERRLSRAPAELLVFFDPAHPEECFVSLSPAMPSELAPIVGTNPADFAAALKVYLRDGEPGVTDQPKIVRIGARVEVSLARVGDSFENLELWLDDAQWGSGCENDPFRGIESASAIDIARIRRRASAQQSGSMPSLSVRTLWSKSIICFEKHPFGNAVFELRYTPTEDPTTLRRFLTQHVPLPIPEDLPVDVAASLLRAPLAPFDSLTAGVPEGTATPTLLSCLASVAAGEPETTRMFQQWVEKNSENQAALISASDVFQHYGCTGLLWEIYGQLRPGAERDELGKWLMRTPEEWRGSASATQAESEVQA